MKVWIPIVLVVVAGWAVWDLAGPRRADIRSFDPDAVARLDTEMWRAYYDRKPVPLFLELAETMRRQFHFPLLRSYVAAVHGARAALVFKRGHARSDYERALPDLVAYFGAIRGISGEPFDVSRAARLELEWWIVHREKSSSPDLERALADAAAALYRVPAPRLAEYAHWRSEAMGLRDRGGLANSLTEADWARIGDELRTCWQSLHSAIQLRTARVVYSRDR